MRERWPNPRRSSGANERALLSDSGVFLAVMLRTLIEMEERWEEPSEASALEAPLPDGLALDGPEDQVLDHETDSDDSQEPCEDGWDVEQVAVLENEPAQSALPRRHTEDELRRDQRAPRKGPADLQAGQDRREGRRHQDLEDVGKPFQTIVSSDHAQGLSPTQKVGMGVERHRPEDGVDEDEDQIPVAEPKPDQGQRKQ